MIDDTVTQEYLDWLASIRLRHGVGGNQAWNAGAKWMLNKMLAELKYLNDAAEAEPHASPRLVNASRTTSMTIFALEKQNDN